MASHSHMHPHTWTASQRDHQLCNLLLRLYNSSLYGHNPIIVQQSPDRNGHLVFGEHPALEALLVYTHYLTLCQVSDMLPQDLVRKIFNKAYLAVAENAYSALSR